MSADLLNIPLGLAVLGYGLGHTAITEDQETGPPGELFDVHSKAFNNIVSIKSIEQFKEKETDVFGIEETAKRLTSGIPVVTHLDNLNKISHRSGKVIYGEDNRYVPLMLPSDVSEWMSTRDGEKLPWALLKLMFETILLLKSHLIQQLLILGKLHMIHNRQRFLL